MSGMGQLSLLVARGVPFTPKSDQSGVKVKLKVFWKTTRFWTQADIIDYQQNVLVIASRLRNEREYWNKHGEIRQSKFTCEDFAIRVLSEFASSKELPVKLTTGVRTYRNMEMYRSSEHDKYASNKYGFSEMVMKTYGAPDMQRTGINTVVVEKPECLQPGDILALANDLKAGPNHTAHHIQVVYQTPSNEVKIYQGNSNAKIHWPLTWAYKAPGMNVADPQDSAYGGQPIEVGRHIKTQGEWEYDNFTTRHHEKNYLKYFDLFRWNFKEFNK